MQIVSGDKISKPSQKIVYLWDFLTNSTISLLQLVVDICLSQFSHRKFPWYLFNLANIR